MQKKIKGDVLSICFSDVLSEYLEIFFDVLSMVILMFQEEVPIFWKMMF